METYAYRMYFLVPYALTGIQKGIQAGHAAVEYAEAFGNGPEYRAWFKNDKTFILLNGGTMNNVSGTIERHLASLQENKVRVATFREPDLNDAISALAFLVDERVFDHRQYPLPDYPTSGMSNNWGSIPPSEAQIDAYNTQILRILGSPQNVFLREFLRQFHLAQN